MSIELEAARLVLFTQAQEFSKNPQEAALQRGLCDAASAYAKARTQMAGGGLTIPFGRSKGTPLADASDKDLAFVLKVSTEGLDNPEKANFRESNLALIKAITAIQATR